MERFAAMNRECRKNEDSRILKYMVGSEQDRKWGLSVTTVGMSSVSRGYNCYPERAGHPSDYCFDIARGRVIDEYQLVYIAEGRGYFYTSLEHYTEVRGGDIFILRPSVWHNYYPDPATGWVEYWIGFTGFITDLRFQNGFFPETRSLYTVADRIGFSALFMEAIGIARKEGPYYQQTLAGIVDRLLGLVLYYADSGGFVSRRTTCMDRAKTLIRENICEDITSESIAAMLNMSYTSFRRIFRKYMDMSPGRYIRLTKIEIARELLVCTDCPVKEIAFKLRYEDHSHFIRLFKSAVGYTPAQYRKINRSEDRTRKNTPEV